MVHEKKHDPVGLLLGCDQMTHRLLDGRELALLPIVIDHHAGWFERDFFANLVGVRAENNEHRRDLGMASNVEKVLKESCAPVGDQRLGGTHAAGFAPGENDGGEHERLSEPEREWRALSRPPCASGRRPRGARQSIRRRC